MGEEDMASMDARDGPACGFVCFGTVCEDIECLSSFPGAKPDLLLSNQGLPFYLGTGIRFDG